MAQPIIDSDFDRATDPEYAAICPMAVVGLILGVLGVTALVAAPLVAVPVAAVVLSLVSLRRIGRSRGVLAGRKLALAGLALGIATAVLGGGYHGHAWLSERLTLRHLKTQALETIDDILADRYEKVFEKLPEKSDQRRAGLDAFRKGLSLLLEGAGDLVDRDLLSLQILSTDRGDIVAPAGMRVRLERRILEVNLWFRLREDGQWHLEGIGGQETFESVSTYAPKQGPPAVPGPYERR
ncbi:MAG TPA: hypothetical protein VM431_15210 [Phycisphaerae bacterium]|nr:hypothetical protein [Phycisphaerae bacterium]